MALFWPAGVHRVTAALLLPTMIPRGSITWVQPPRETSLQLCREIDVLAAVRAALSVTPPMLRTAPDALDAQPTELFASGLTTGGDVLIEEPTELRAAVVTHLRRALDAYENAAKVDLKTVAAGFRNDDSRLRSTRGRALTE